MAGKVENAKIAAVARDWLGFQRTELRRFAWAVDELHIWLAEEEDWSAIERFMRAVCAAATIDEAQVVGMIGAGPLEDMIDARPERAIAFLESEIEDNHVLADALASVWCDKPDVAARIDEIRRRSR
ncbi:MAG TPA: hypothetical protein VGN13_09365 [Solirubrobacteraceae bacterium]|jgi:hypothetical protein